MKRLISFVLILLLITPVFAYNGDATVYITNTGECYHSSGCRYLSKSCHETTLYDAVSDGYRKCSRCSPPSPDFDVSINIPEPELEPSLPVTNVAPSTSASTATTTAEPEEPEITENEISPSQEQTGTSANTSSEANTKHRSKWARLTLKEKILQIVSAPYILMILLALATPVLVLISIPFEKLFHKLRDKRNAKKLFIATEKIPSPKALTQQQPPKQLHSAASAAPTMQKAVYDLIAAGAQQCDNIDLKKQCLEYLSLLENSEIPDHAITIAVCNAIIEYTKHQLDIMNGENM